MEIDLTEEDNRRRVPRRLNDKAAKILGKDSISRDKVINTLGIEDEDIKKVALYVLNLRRSTILSMIITCHDYIYLR